MLKLPIPIIRELKPLVEKLLQQEIDIYLHGKLGENIFFVDIDWKTAAHLNDKLTAPWTLIYAYFISNEAILEGKKDPLLSGMDIKDILANYRPSRYTDTEFKEIREELIEHAEYLLQFPPSRLVYLGGHQISNEDLDHLTNVIEQIKR